MDLYLIGSKYVGTQADARGEAKAQGIRFNSADHSIKVPTDKAGLIAYLNEHLPAPVVPERSAVALPPVAAERPIRDMSAGAVLARSDNPGLDVDAVVETIMAASGYALKRFSGAVAVAFQKLT